MYVANRKLSLGGGEDLSTWEPASDDHWRCNLNLAGRQGVEEAEKKVEKEVGFMMEV